MIAINKQDLINYLKKSPENNPLDSMLINIRSNIMTIHHLTKEAK